MQETARTWSSQAFNDLREEWYEKLSESGFTDIEVVLPGNEDTALVRFHSFDLLLEGAQARREKRSPYQSQIDLFANDPQFPEILRLIVKHGNSKFSTRQIEYVWSMHRDGITERRIASEMKVSQSCIHFLLKRMRAWMKLIA